jgi:hypothetical protein
MDSVITYNNNAIEITSEKTDDPNRPIISFIFEGIELKSRIDERFRSSDASAQWLSPVELTERVIYAHHIPYWGMFDPYYHNGVIQQKTISAIAFSMIHDFKIHQTFMQHGTFLVTRLRELLAEEIGKLPESTRLSDDDYKRSKAALKKRFRAGEFSSIALQHQLKQIKNFNKAYHAAIFDAKHALRIVIKQRGLVEHNNSDMKFLLDHALKMQDSEIPCNSSHPTPNLPPSKP